jgi:hypothetical protein
LTEACNTTIPVSHYPYSSNRQIANSKPDTENNKVNIRVSVDKGKIESDVAKAEKKIIELAGKAKAREVK